MRPPFLILTPISVLLGYAPAQNLQVDISYWDLLLVLFGSLSAHASVNLFNEYVDFKSGLDMRTHKTPFSGGSGALPNNPASAKAVLVAAIVCLAMTLLVGGYYLFNLGILLAPIGILGILLILTYTPWLNRSPLLCLFAPGLGFGPLMVIGTYLVLTSHYSLLVCLLSLIPFFLVNNLLLLNQLPDIEADKQVGRRHFPIVYGISHSCNVYLVFAMMTFFLLLAGIFLNYLPIFSAISLIPLLAMPWVYVRVRHNHQNLDKLIPYLGVNVFITLLTPTLLALSLLFAY